MSYYAISANGVPWQRLTSAVTAYYAARFYLTNPAIATEDGNVPAGTLSLVISRTVGEGIHEDLDVTNHGQATVRFNLEIALRSDFADLFEVKGGQLVRRGRIITRWQGEAGPARDVVRQSRFPSEPDLPARSPAPRRRTTQTAV